MKNVLLIIAVTSCMVNAQTLIPSTRRVETVDTFHGTAVADPYRWLENDRDPEVEAWVAEQAHYADAYLSKIPFRQGVLDRLDQVNNYEQYSQPWHRNELLFFYKNDGKQNHPILYLQNGSNSVPEVLLDPNTFSADGTISLAFAVESPDGKYLAFGKSEGGSDWRDIYIMDLETRQLLSDTILGVKNSQASWTANGFYYTRFGTSVNTQKSLIEKNSVAMVYFHQLGTDQSADRIIYSDPSKPQQFVGCYELENSKYTIMWMRGAASGGNEIYVRPSSDETQPWKKVYSSTEFGFFPFYDHHGVLYGTTDNDAPNGKVVRLISPLGDAKFEDVVNETSEVLESCSYGGGRMFITWMKDVHHRVDIVDFDGNKIGSVPLPGNGTVGGFQGAPEDTVLYYTFSSHTYPTTIYRYSLADGESTVWQRVKSAFNPDDYTSEQVFVTSKDATSVPMFILSKKGSIRDGKSPTILYGYGGFNRSLNPSFDPNFIPWLEQGGVIAIANLRGGGEYGEDWHQAGTRTRKQNVFDDAIACAEWLITNKVSNANMLSINGGSNGGLLVGAVINQRPDLFRVAVPEVGVMDMLRFHLFTIGWNWQADYGEIEKADEFSALLAYSPYHQLRTNVAYPSTMIMTADHDDRVVPAHSFKYAAMLQHVYAGSRPMLLRVQVKSGHGAVNRKKRLEGTADKYAFIWWEMGITPKY